MADSLFLLWFFSKMPILAFALAVAFVILAFIVGIYLDEDPEEHAKYHLPLPSTFLKLGVFFLVLMPISYLIYAAIFFHIDPDTAMMYFMGKKYMLAKGVDVILPKIADFDLNSLK